MRFRNHLPMDVNGSKKIKVAFFEHSLPRAGGAENVLFEIISRIDRSRFEPVLCCLYDLGELGSELQRQGFRTYEHLAHGKFNPRNLIRLRRILQAEATDVLYVSDGFHNVILGRLAAWLARTKHTVLAIHSYDLQHNKAERSSYARSKVLQVSSRLTFPTFSKVIALANSHRDYLVHTKGLEQHRIAVIPNGVQSDRFAKHISVEAARHQFGLPVDHYACGIVAGLRKVKAHDLYLEAAAEVLTQKPDTVFVIAGQGPERERLQQLARDLGIAQSVFFLGHVGDVSELLAALNVCVLCSHSEAFPLSLLEAMAAGLPVIATDVGSVGDLVADGVNGFLIPSGDSNRLASAILEMIDSPQLAKQFGEAGRKLAQQRYGVDRMIQLTEELLVGLVSSSSGGSP